MLKALTTIAEIQLKIDPVSNKADCKKNRKLFPTQKVGCFIFMKLSEKTKNLRILGKIYKQKGLKLSFRNTGKNKF